MATLRVTNVGGSAGIVLPKQILQRLGVATGDVLYVTDTPDGIQLCPYSTEPARSSEPAQLAGGKAAKR